MNQKPPQADPTDRVMKIPPVDHPHHEEALLDQAIAESFPASDPISPAVEALKEPADTQWNERFTYESARFRERVRRNAPALVAIATAATALLVMRALRGDRNRGDDYEVDYE